MLENKLTLSDQYFLRLNANVNSPPLPLASTLSHMILYNSTRFQIRCFVISAFSRFYRHGLNKIYSNMIQLTCDSCFLRYL